MNENILNIIDLDDILYKIDIYNEPFLESLFFDYKIILKYKPTQIYIFYSFKIIFFLQILMTSVINIPNEIQKKDNIIKFLVYIKKILYPHLNIDNETIYYLILGIGILITIVIIFLSLYIHFNKKKNFKICLVKYLNYIILILINYGLCPLVNTFLLSIKCKEKIHIYTGFKCYSSFKQILIIFVSILCLLLIIGYSFLISIYYYQIGNIKNIHQLIRLNTNYEIIENIFVLIYYSYNFFQVYYIEPEDYIYNTINHILLICTSIFMFIYITKNVMYYEKCINILLKFGWIFIAWFSFCIEFCRIVKIEDSTI